MAPFLALFTTQDTTFSVMLHLKKTFFFLSVGVNLRLRAKQQHNSFLIRAAPHSECRHCYLTAILPSSPSHCVSYLWCPLNFTCYQLSERLITWPCSWIAGNSFPKQSSQRLHHTSQDSGIRMKIRMWGCWCWLQVNAFREWSLIPMKMFSKS